MNILSKLFLVGALASPLAAAPIDFKQIPATSAWYLHGDIEAVRETTVGNELKTAIEKQLGGKLKAAESLLSIRPLEDIHSVTIFGDGSEEQAVLMLQADFNRQHLEAIVAGADNYSSSTHESLTVHNWTDGGQDNSAAFFNDKLLLISQQQANLTHSLDVLAGRKPALKGQKAEIAPLVLGLAQLDKMKVKLDEDDANIVKHATAIKASLDEKNKELVASVEISTRHADSANKLRRLVDGLFAMLEVSTPELDEYGIDGDIQFGDNKTSIIANLRMPSQNVIEFLKYLDSLDENGDRKED